MEVKECIKQLEATEQLSHSTQDENIFSEEKEEQQSAKKIPELQELPSHLKYVFLSDDKSRPAIISSTLTPVEEEKLMKVLRSNQEALGWSISDLKGISPAYCTHKIHMEAEYKPVVQPQR
jgi:hypothetical protein